MLDFCPFDKKEVHVMCCQTDILCMAFLHILHMCVYSVSGHANVSLHSTFIVFAIEASNKQSCICHRFIEAT